jgi:hypothetical protein
MSAFCPDAAAEYRQQAEKIRIIAAQIWLLEAKVHLLEAAEYLDGLAADEGS